MEKQNNYIDRLQGIIIGMSFAAALFFSFSEEWYNNSPKYVPQNVYHPLIDPQLQHLQDSVKLVVNSDVDEIKWFFRKDKNWWNIFGEKIEDFLKMVYVEHDTLRYADSGNWYLISPDNSGKLQVFKVDNTNNWDNNEKTTKIWDFTLKQNESWIRNVEIHSEHEWQQSETKEPSPSNTIENKNSAKVSYSLRLDLINK